MTQTQHFSFGLRLRFAKSGYRRRSVPDKDNPWAGRADAFRKTLKMITAGDLKLSVAPAPPEVDPPGSIVTWESELGAPGRILG